jgi:hypothetical protein
MVRMQRSCGKLQARCGKVKAVCGFRRTDDSEKARGINRLIQMASRIASLRPKFIIA